MQPNDRETWEDHVLATLADGPVPLDRLIEAHRYAVPPGVAFRAGGGTDPNDADAAIDKGSRIVLGDAIKAMLAAGDLVSTPDGIALATACHPDRDRYALGLCLPCYHRHYRKARKALGRPMASALSRKQRQAVA